MRLAPGVRVSKVHTTCPMELSRMLVTGRDHEQEPSLCANGDGDSELCAPCLPPSRDVMMRRHEPP